MKDALCIVLLAGLSLGGLAWWVVASADCDARHGVLVNNAWGFPACVAGAP